MNSKLFKQIPEHEKSTCRHCKKTKANWLFFYTKELWNYFLCDECGTDPKIKKLINE